MHTDKKRFWILLHWTHLYTYLYKNVFNADSNLKKFWTVKKSINWLENYEDATTFLLNIKTRINNSYCSFSDKSRDKLLNVSHCRLNYMFTSAEDTLHLLPDYTFVSTSLFCGGLQISLLSPQFLKCSETKMGQNKAIIHWKI